MTTDEIDTIIRSTKVDNSDIDDSIPDNGIGGTIPPIPDQGVATDEDIDNIIKNHFDI